MNNNQNVTNNPNGYSLQDLTAMIRKCCYRPDNAESRFQFEIDYVKLENILKQKQTNLHVLGFNRIAQSKPVTIQDTQFISEYIKNRNVFDSALSGDSEIVSFMLFSTVNENGDIRPKYFTEDGEKVDIPDKDLFTMCNEPDKIVDDLVKVIVNEQPVYRVIVVRLFSDRNDRYDYNVNIRSNYQMIQYQRSIRNGDVVVADEGHEEGPFEEAAAEEE